MKTLVVIPARGGSKGLPGKNIKSLHGKPLIQYSIETARALFRDVDICVSTDDVDIRECAEKVGLKIPFMRPAHLARDASGTYEVLLHAVEFYEKECGAYYDNLLLLQPTTPIRNVEHIKEILRIWNSHPEVEMIASVRESKDNPYFNLFEQDMNGYIQKSKVGRFERRQDCPKVYAFNGSIYLISIGALKLRRLNDFTKVMKYLMPDEIHSIDIDSARDWIIAERLLDDFLNSGGLSNDKIVE